mgnify:FL=1
MYSRFATRIAYMDKNNSILIYEKENHLNSILYQQVSDNNNYETYAANDQINLFKLVNKKTFDICILNIEDIDTKLTNFLDVLLYKNQYINIIGYGQNLSKNNIINNYKIKFLQKPFRFNVLLEKIYDIKLTKKEVNKINLTKNIEFLPNKKILYNLKTKFKLHLTEKENSLLNYLYNNRHLKLTKNDLLINIWGVTEGINTHTLETHLYRLKQKLFKLEANLYFILINENGFYSLKYL